MKIKSLLFPLLALIILSSCTKKAQLPQRIELSESWTLTQNSNQQTISKSLKIPTTVASDLMHAGVIPDPFKANNEEKVQWIAQEEWSYSTLFDLSKDQLNKDHLYLNFDGLNTYANVYLNDSLIHKNSNAFVKSRIFVKEILKEKNHLKVIFLPTTPFEIEANEAHPYTLPYTTANDNRRVFTRKGQFEYGWDWGPVLNTMGFSKPVYLDIYNGLKIKNVYLQQQSLTDSIASMNAQIELEDLSAFEKIKFDILVNGTQVSSADYAGINNGAANFNIPFEIKNPKRWWPHNLGDPYIYDIEVIARQDGIERDRWNFKKGLRTIELVNEKDSIGESFYFKINNVPVYAKGANYIPQNSMQNLVRRQDYERLLGDVVKANMNMVRVWGGGNYEQDIFYETCDKKGIMVWQDFMFACAMYPADKRFRESVKEEATQQVTRLRNHASVVLFNGNNENSEAWHRWGWKDGRGEEEREYIWNEYQALFTGILPTAVEKYSDIPYWESSPKYGRGDQRYETHANAHDWWVWHDAFPFEHYEEHVPRFSSEFGFQSHPSYEVIQYINSDGSNDINSTDYATHQKHPRGNALIREYMERDFPVPESDEDYVYISQLLQAYGISKAINAQRRSRPRSMGTLYWQLNDCWPAVSWSSLDYFGNWKALHYQATRDYENVLVSVSVINNNLTAYIVNDQMMDQTGNFKLETKAFDNSAVNLITEENLTIPAGSSIKVFELDLSTYPLDAEYIYVKSTFQNASKVHTLVAPKDLKLFEPDVYIKSKKVDNGFKITLKTNVFVKNLFLISSSKGHFSDNYFDLEPDTEKVIYLECDPNEAAVIEIKTLNTILARANLEL